jgi:glycerol kinase
MEELDILIVDLTEEEQDSIFKALIEDIVFDNEEVFEVMKDDFFI